jgi:hypothetical protein
MFEQYRQVFHNEANKKSKPFLLLLTLQSPVSVIYFNKKLSLFLHTKEVILERVRNKKHEFLTLYLILPLYFFISSALH